MLNFKKSETQPINRELQAQEAYNELYKKHTAGLQNSGFTRTDAIDGTELWTRERPVLEAGGVQLPFYDAVQIESNRENGSVDVTKRLPRYSRRFEPSDAEKAQAKAYDDAWERVNLDEKRAEQERRKNLVIAEIDKFKASGFKVVHQEKNHEVFIRVNEDHTRSFVVVRYPTRDAWERGDIPAIAVKQYAKSLCTSSEKEIIAFCRQAVNLDENDPDIVSLPFDIAAAALAILDSGADMPPDHPGYALSRYPELNHARLQPRIQKSMEGDDTFIITGIYSEVDKSLEGDSIKRIRFIASTANVDREMDRVLSFKPLSAKGVPLLINHNTDRPIGRVFKAETTDAGLLCDAEINFFSPDGLYAWQSMKAGHLCEFSIKFRTDQFKTNREGGRDYQGAEILEISLVTVPANAETALLELEG